MEASRAGKPEETSQETPQPLQSKASSLQPDETDLATLKLSEENVSQEMDADEDAKAEGDEVKSTSTNDHGDNEDLGNSETVMVKLDEGHTNPAVLKIRESTKSKKKKKSSGKPKSAKPSGFEEYYVDPPLTPAEYDEEQNLYSSKKPFPERYMLAIARYTNRRKFNEFRSKVFDRYMSYSGVGAGVKAFQGKGEEKVPDMTTTDVAILKSKYNLKPGTLENSVVSFNSVVRGFLSSYLPSVQEMHRPEEFKECTKVIRNFLNYLLHHDVCPEYADQIYEAKKSCDEADIQLPRCSKLVQDLPGTFNQACSILFGGHYQDMYIEDLEQAKAFNITPGMRRDEASRIFLAGFAALGTEPMVEAYNAQAKEGKITIKQQHTGHLEVVSVHAPPAEALELYGLASQRGLRPVATIKFSFWRHPSGPFTEMTPEEVRAYKTAPYERPEYEMFLDIDLLPQMKAGTRIYCAYQETSFGLWYFDAIYSVLSPMYTWLQNEPMMDWVVPKELPWKARPSQTDNSENMANPSEDVGGQDLDGKKDEGDSDEDIPKQFKTYEKGEDIVIKV